MIYKTFTVTKDCKGTFVCNPTLSISLFVSWHSGWNSNSLSMVYARERSSRRGTLWWFVSCVVIQGPTWTFICLQYFCSTINNRHSTPSKIPEGKPINTPSSWRFLAELYGNARLIKWGGDHPRYYRSVKRIVLLRLYYRIQTNQVHIIYFFIKNLVKQTRLFSHPNLET